LSGVGRNIMAGKDFIIGMDYLFQQFLLVVYELEERLWKYLNPLLQEFLITYKYHLLLLKIRGKILVFSSIISFILVFLIVYENFTLIIAQDLLQFFKVDYYFNYYYHRILKNSYYLTFSLYYYLFFIICHLFLIFHFFPQ